MQQMLEGTFVDFQARRDKQAMAFRDAILGQ